LPILTVKTVMLKGDHMHLTLLVALNFMRGSSIKLTTTAFCDQARQCFDTGGWVTGRLVGWCLTAISALIVNVMVVSNMSVRGKRKTDNQCCQK